MKNRPQETRLIERLKNAETLLKAIMAHDGGAYDLEPWQSSAIMHFLGGGDGRAFTPAQLAGNNWNK